MACDMRIYNSKSMGRPVGSGGLGPTMGPSQKSCGSPGGEPVRAD